MKGLSPATAAWPDMPVHLALDIGSATIGLAACDDEEESVRALYTITRLNRKRDVAAVAEEAGRCRAEVIVVGLAVRSAGEEGDSARRARKLGELVREATGLPVVYQDERLSTFEAGERLRAQGYTGEAFAARIDAEAARVILEDYLARRPSI
ncbi:MAG: Holliday junction resolvase RuvX [Armatimonadetes bacterium]|nr:Holliday junction resolvase RuvX [Armatimonadota bacterium]